MGKRKPTGPPTISDQLRKAIKDSGRTHYELAQAAGVTADIISRFVDGKRGLTLRTVDRIAAALGLRLTEGGETK